MASAIILSGAQGGAALKKLLQAEGIENVVIESDPQLTLAHARADDPALILINPARIDTAAGALARRLAQESCAGVILLAAREERARADECARPAGIFVVEKPVAAPLMRQAAADALAAHVRLSSMRAENIRLGEKLDELTLTGRAKKALMQYLNMTEEEAHRYIEKQAMNRRVSKLEVIKSILKNYAG